MSTGTSGLRIAVIIKQVPDINAVTIDPVTRHPRLGNDRIMNTYDAYAVGEAIGIKERFGANVTVVTAGSHEAREVLMRALATGADDAILIDFPDHNEVDSLAIAKVISRELANHGFDLVLAGQSTDDYESGQVGPQVAELLRWPHVSLVTHVDLNERSLRVRRDAEASKETIEVPLPAVLMVLSGRDSEQRYPTLRGMMAAKKKTILLVSPDQDTDDLPRIEWSEPAAVDRAASGIILEGLPADQAASELVAWLKEHKLA
jgi:electron transfer flavoprotein beta subunit